MPLLASVFSFLLDSRGQLFHDNKISHFFLRLARFLVTCERTLSRLYHFHKCEIKIYYKIMRKYCLFFAFICTYSYSVEIDLQNRNQEPAEISSQIERARLVDGESSINFLGGSFTATLDDSYSIGNIRLLDGSIFFQKAKEFKVVGNIGVKGSTLFAYKTFQWDGLMSVERFKSSLQNKDGFFNFFIDAKLKGGELEVKKDSHLCVAVYNKNQMVKALRSGEPVLELTGTLRMDSGSSLLLFLHNDFSDELLPGTYPLIRAKEISAEGLKLEFEVPYQFSPTYKELSSDQKSKISLEISENIVFLVVNP